MNFKQRCKKVLALIMGFCMMFSMLGVSTYADPVNIDDGVSSQADAASSGAVIRVADPSTADDYTGIMGTDEDGGRYAGRVWTDKSVYAKGNDGIPEGFALGDDEDFLIQFSALGSSRVVNTEASVDLVLVLDISGSMGDPLLNGDQDGNHNGGANFDSNDNQVNGYARMAKMISGVNELMEKFLDPDQNVDKKNRISIVLYDSSAYVLLPLDYYTKASDSNYYITAKRSHWQSWGPGGQWASRIETHCLNNDGNTINNVVTSTTNTNTMAGISAGMQELVNADTKWNGEKFRIPAMVLLSDGEPCATISDSSRLPSDGVYYASSWNDLANSQVIGSGIVQKDVFTGNPVYDNTLGLKPTDLPSTFISDGIKTYAAGTGHLYTDYTSSTLLQTLMHASYMKTQVEDHYLTSPMIYTIGYGLNSADAYAMMNPAQYFNSVGVADIKNAERVYNPRYSESVQKNFTTETDKDQPGSYQLWLKWIEGIELTVTTPNTGSAAARSIVFKQAADDAMKQRIEANINYTDRFFKVDDEGSYSVGNAFDDILSLINGRAFHPVEDAVTGTANTTTFTYTDEIGDFLEVKDIKGLKLFGQFYSAKGSSDADGNGTYHFEADLPRDNYITHPTYVIPTTVDIPDSVTVNIKKQSDRQILTIQIAQNTLPIRSETVTVDGMDESKVIGYSSNKDTPDAQPLQIFYSVGLGEEYRTDNGKINLGEIIKVDPTYIEEHSRNINGTDYIDFYSNLYTGETGDHCGYGDALVRFTPSSENRYYYFQKNRVIYSAVEGVQPGNDSEVILSVNGVPEPGIKIDHSNAVADINQIVDAEFYYLVIDFYRPSGNGGGELVEMVVERSGAEIRNAVTYIDALAAGSYYTATATEYDISGTGRVVATKREGVRLGRLNRFTQMKGENGVDNNTDTSRYYYAPFYGQDNHDGTSVDDATRIFTVHLGNNGRLSIPYEAHDLDIEKLQLVTHPDGTTTPDTGVPTKDRLLVDPGDEVTYYLQVTNVGIDEVSGIVVTDKIPEGLTLVEGDDAISDGGTVSADYVITWNLEPLQAGDSKEVYFKVAVPGEEMISALSDNDEEGAVDNKQNRIIDPSEEEPADNGQGIIPDWDEGQSDNGDDDTQSDNGNEDTGEETVADDQDITDSEDTEESDGENADSGIELQSASYPPAETMVSAPEADGIDALSDREARTWKNIATVSADDIDPEDSNEVEIITNAPVINLIKKQKVNDGELTEEKLEVKAGDTVTYYLTVTNSGPIAAEDVVVTDEVPQGLQFKEAYDGGMENNGMIT